MNGEQGNQLIDNNARWKGEVFTPLVNTLIAEIVQLGGEADLTRTFAQFRKEFEPALQQIRDRLMTTAMDRGLEP
jgi:hypothetical protein